MKKIYILSDAHLGSWAIEHRRTHERRLVSFLDKVKKDAMAVYLLGDIGYSINLDLYGTGNVRSPYCDIIQWFPLSPMASVV